MWGLERGGGSDLRIVDIDVEQIVLEAQGNVVART